MNRKLPAESFISLLIAITIFSMLLLSYSAWQKSQFEQAMKNYQQQQALQIAENQLALLMAKMNCEQQAVQNGIKFTIQCSGNQISLNYPLGRLEINANK